VQDGIVEQTTGLILSQLLQLPQAPHCHYRHHVIFVNQLSQEAKIALYVSRMQIIKAIQKKLLEHYHLNIIIKDIRIGNV